MQSDAPNDSASPHSPYTRHQIHRLQTETHSAGPATRPKSRRQDNTGRVLRHQPASRRHSPNSAIPLSVTTSLRGQKFSAPATFSTRNRKKHINRSLITSTPFHLLMAGSRNITADTPTVDAQSNQMDLRNRGNSTTPVN